MSAPVEHGLALSPPSPVKRVLHVFPSFGIGGLPLRMCRVINHFDKSLSHIVMALDGNFEAKRDLSPELDLRFLEPIRRTGDTLRTVVGNVAMLRQLRPDLLLTYNWGSIEWAIARKLVSTPSHIHFEAGFGKEEADGQIRRRVLCRRWALRGCAQVVVPSRLLERLARETWRLPSNIINYIPNGVDVRRFSTIAGRSLTMSSNSDEVVVGTIAPLRPEKNIGRLLAAFSRVDSTLPARLIVAGEGTQRAMLESFAENLGISDRVTFIGLVKPEAVLPEFDVFALSSDTEQMPNALLEAMAASLPIAAVDVGDVRSIVSEENRPFVVARDERPLADALENLLRDLPLRRRLALANCERVANHFSLEGMLARYSNLFASVLSFAATSATFQNP